MPILGLLLGHEVAYRIGSTGRYAGAALLTFNGGYSLWRSRFTEKSEVGEARGLHFKQLLLAAFALSIDNLIVGFALSLYRVPVLSTSALIAAVSVGMTIAGLELGNQIGARVAQRSEEIGAAVLILVGIALALGWL